MKICETFAQFRCVILILIVVCILCTFQILMYFEPFQRSEYIRTTALIGVVWAFSFAWYYQYSAEKIENSLLQLSSSITNANINTVAKIAITSDNPQSLPIAAKVIHDIIKSDTLNHSQQVESQPSETKTKPNPRPVLSFLKDIESNKISLKQASSSPPSSPPLQGLILQKLAQLKKIQPNETPPQHSMSPMKAELLSRAPRID